MNKETYEALKHIVKETRTFMNEKWGERKRLNRDEVWRRATTYRDIVQLEKWIEEVAKEYIDN